MQYDCNANGLHGSVMMLVNKLSNDEVVNYLGRYPIDKVAVE